MENQAVIAAVIALLNGINVDGETMQHILEKTNMTDQMKSQLGVESAMPYHVLDTITNDIVSDLVDEGVDLLEDQEYGINANEIYLESVTYDKYRMNRVIKHVLESHFTPVE
jgi:hypothetical protein